MKIPAVVVLYNPSDTNLKNIDNYISSVDRLYVVDNSNDDIVRFKDEGKIKYIKFGENKGIAHALNVGANNAIEEGYKYILTLDQDSMITSNQIEEMIEYLHRYKNDDLGLISPYHELKFQTDCPLGNVEERLEVMTSGNIINLDAFTKVGGFKDWLFIDGVDTEFCLRLNKNNYKVLRLNKIKMNHELGNIKVHNFFGKKIVTYDHEPIRMYYIVRNNFYINSMYKDIYPEHCAWLIRCLKGQKRRIIIFEKNKLKKLYMMKKGYKDFKKGVKGSLK